MEASLVHSTGLAAIGDLTVSFELPPLDELLLPTRLSRAFLFRT